MKNPDRPMLPDDDAGVLIQMVDGTRIYKYSYLPVKDPTTTIYIISGVTGINHNVERDLLLALSDGRNRIVVMHPRGTGYSEGERGDGRSFDCLVNDYKTVICQDTKTRYKVVFGHSMSSAVAISVLNELDSIDGVILVNPPVKLKQSGGMTPTLPDYMKYAFYMVFAPHTPVVNMAGDPKSIVDEEERRDSERRQDDMLLVRYFSMDMMLQSRKMMDSMVEKARGAKVPLLLLYGEKDSIVEKEGCVQLFDSWGSDRKSMVYVRNGTHGKQTVFFGIRDVLGWLETLTTVSSR